MAADTPPPGQFIVSAAFLGFGVLAVLSAALLVAMAVAVVRWWRARRHDVGPDALHLQRDVDKYLDRLAANDPEVKAGLARLDAAVRDEQQRGEVA